MSSRERIEKAAREYGWRVYPQSYSGKNGLWCERGATIVSVWLTKRAGVWTAHYRHYRQAAPITGGVDAVLTVLKDHGGAR